LPRTGRKPPAVYNYKSARKALLKLGAIPTGRWHGSHEVFHYTNPKDGNLAIIHLIKHRSGEILSKTMETQLIKMGVPKKVFIKVYFGEEPPHEWISAIGRATSETASSKEE